MCTIGARTFTGPLVPVSNGDLSGLNYTIVYGTGGTVNAQTHADIEVGGLLLPNGTFGAIVDQHAGKDGFNLFPPKSA